MYILAGSCARSRLCPDVTPLEWHTTRIGGRPKLADKHRCYDEAKKGGRRGISSRSAAARQCPAAPALGSCFVFVPASGQIQFIRMSPRDSREVALVTIAPDTITGNGKKERGTRNGGNSPPSDPPLAPGMSPGAPPPSAPRPGKHFAK